MGIRGLSSYIRQHVKPCLQPYMLHDCFVLIDGNNMAYWLFSLVEDSNPEYGGDYDKYSELVKVFFKSLIECNIIPIVIMDGGHPLGNKKLRTTMQRLNQKILMALNAGYKCIDGVLFPVLGLHTFTFVVRELGITIIQTDLEADEDIAAISRSKNWIVMSNDSDFFAFDVPLVLIDSLNFNNIQIGNDISGKTFKYIPCTFFVRDIFTKETGVPSKFFPVLGTIGGNDYVSSSQLDDFLCSLSDTQSKKHGPLMAVRHKKLQKLLTWLAKMKKELPSNVLEKVVLSMRPEKRDKLNRVLTLIYNGYTKKFSHTLVCVSHRRYNSETNKLTNINCDIVEKIKVPVSSHTEKEEMPDMYYDLFECSCGPKNTVFAFRDGTDFPLWFIKYFRHQVITSEIADLITKGSFITRPLIESPNVDCAYLILSQVIVSIFKIIISNNKCGNLKQDNLCKNSKSCSTKDTTSSVVDLGSESDKEDIKAMESEGKCNSKNSKSNSTNTGTTSSVVDLGSESDSDIDEEDIKAMEHEEKCNLYTGGLSWYMRKKTYLCKKQLSDNEMLFDCDLPSLDELQNMDLNKRKTILTSILKVDSDFLPQFLSSDLQLYLLIIVYWYKNSAIGIGYLHVLSILMCLIMFYYINGKIGLLRDSNSFPDFSSMEKKKNETYDSLQEMIDKLSIRECFASCRNLLHFHKKKEQTWYDRKVVHAFSEFQACFYYIQLLNCILRQPFSSLCIKDVWSGTFCYNVYHAFFFHQDDCLKYACNILGNNSILGKQFITLFNLLKENVKLRCGKSLKDKRRKRKRTKKVKIVSVDKVSSNVNSEAESVTFVDEENRFSILAAL